MVSIGALLATAFGVYFLGILAVLFLPKRMTTFSLAGFGGLGSLALLVSGVFALLSDSAYQAQLWNIANMGKLVVTVDHLSGFFLVVSALVSIPASLFAASRIGNSGRHHAKILAALYLGLLPAIVLVLIASDVFLFLLAWEIMSVFVFLLVNSGGKERPGYLMLAVGEAGTLAIMIALLLLAKNSETLCFYGLKASGMSMDPGVRWLVFALSFFGFGIKAGLIPFNFWIPRAYSATPSAFIPLIAGTTLNLGLYGIIRINGDLLPVTQVGPGILMLLVGSVTALTGILYATIEDNFKTLLAHSSIENAGIITTSLGAGAIFVASSHQVAAALALVAALYHTFNHSIFKTLLFMGAGELEGAMKSTSLDQMGGLLKRMPWTGLFVLTGALSISAMPPLNGFVSEWLTLQSLLRSVELASLGVKIAFVTAGVALALTAGLAVTCFVRAFAMGFLGMPRSNEAEKAHETGKPALLSMAFLAILCLALGVLPTFVVPMLDQVVAPLAGASGTSVLVPPFFEDYPPSSELPQEFASEFHDLGAQVGKGMVPLRGLAVIHRGGKENPVVFAMSSSYMLMALMVLLGVCISVVWLVVARHRKVKRRPRWDGGMRRLLPEMTYTATGFAQPVRVVFEMIFRPTVVDRRKTIAEHFRVSIQQNRKQVHLVDRLVLYPMANVSQWISSALARMHNGQINTYAAYGLLSLVLFLIISLAV